MRCTDTELLGASKPVWSYYGKSAVFGLRSQMNGQELKRTWKMLNHCLHYNITISNEPEVILFMSLSFYSLVQCLSGITSRISGYTKHESRSRLEWHYANVSLQNRSVSDIWLKERADSLQKLLTKPTDVYSATYVEPKRSSKKLLMPLNAQTCWKKLKVRVTATTT
jgi:hypothetical protein